MSYFDLAGSLKVVEVVPMTNQTANTTVNPIGGVCSGGSSTGNEETKAACDAASGTWAPGTFTRSFDARGFIGGLFILTVETVGANCTLDVTVQKSSEPLFGSFSDCTKVGGGTAAFTSVTASNDNQIFYCKVDFSNAQNVVGVKAVTTNSSGTNRARWGLTAVLFPIDTTNATTPQFEV